MAWADHGETGNGEPLALVLRAGNAGSNTAADHIEAARLAIGQLPRHLRCTVLVRADSGVRDVRAGDEYRQPVVFS